LGLGPYTNNACELEHYLTHAQLLHLLPTLKINIKKCVDNLPSFSQQSKWCCEDESVSEIQEILVSSMIQTSSFGDGVDSNSFIWRWGSIFKS
jgi:hypothetical protein